ncbi:speckle-type POZ protein-like [Daphnia pulicaria]|jgi:hypothetical protein|uniref:speckle-type POZ protein-like n=1 Tax=Daphnia pulicaria TaxID=35523 RepID=UPI001EEB5AE9|nr:speckle-type POZ protein-like [Daphnia pulicaria]
MAQQVINNAALSTKTDLPPAISLASSSFWCQTKATVEEIDLEWTIERLTFLDNGGMWEPLSAEFSNNIKLSINLDPHSQIVGIKLLYPAFSSPIKVELAIFNEKCKKIFQNTISIRQPTKFLVNVFDVSKKDLLESGDFLNGNITIYCKIGSLKRNVLKGKATATEGYLHKTPTRDNNQDRILHQLEELFEKMPLSDVTFNIRGRKFGAHKAILAMTSPVFAAICFSTRPKSCSPDRWKWMISMLMSFKKFFVSCTPAYHNQQPWTLWHRHFWLLPTNIFWKT